MNSPPNSPQQYKNTSWVVVAHTVIIIIIWLSPFLFRWQFIIPGIIVYYLQLIIIGDCALNRVQFNEKKRTTSFYSYLLGKVGLYPNRNHVLFVADYIMPWIILGSALIIQCRFNVHPLVY